MAELAVLGAFLAENIGTIGTIASVAGTAVGAAGTLAAGRDAKQRAAFEAAQLDAKGKEEQAASQREAEQYRRRKELALSSLTNKAAAGGFTATDPTSLAIADEIAEYGTMQEQMAMFGGSSRRAGLETQAMAARMEGDSRASASKWSAASTILGGVSTLADKYAPKPAATASYRYGSGASPGPWKTSVSYG